MALSKLISDFLGDFHFHCKLKKEVLNFSKSLLDLGCGADSPVKFFSNKLEYSLGVDSFEPYIEQSKKAKIHSNYLLSDIFEACKKLENKSFDCVLALDLIEHLDKDSGLLLIKEMERISRKKIIIYTPNGFLAQNELDDNCKQRHLSGWYAEDFKKLGFQIYGMSGFKFLRDKEGNIKYKPHFFWQKIISFSQLICYKFPKLSFQIFCVKDLNK